MPAPKPRPQLIRPRVTLLPDVPLGPGKVDLLQAIAEHGSISASARALGMGYRRAWTLLNELQQAFGQPLVETAAGGTGGGGAKITDLGRAVLACYLDLEAACNTASAPALARLAQLMKP